MFSSFILLYIFKNKQKTFRDFSAIFPVLPSLNDQKMQEFKGTRH